MSRVASSDTNRFKKLTRRPPHPATIAQMTQHEQDTLVALVWIQDTHMFLIDLMGAPHYGYDSRMAVVVRNAMRQISDSADTKTVCNFSHFNTTVSSTISIIRRYATEPNIPEMLQGTQLLRLCLQKFINATSASISAWWRRYDDSVCIDISRATEKALDILLAEGLARITRLETAIQRLSSRPVNPVALGTTMENAIRIDSN